MTNAMESIGKHVEQEAAHELANGELHDFALVVAILTIVLPAKADMLIGEIEQPAVADGDAMGVPRKIGQDLLRSCERTLGVDDPFLRAQGSEVGLECFSVVEGNEFGEELQLASIESCCETFEEQAPEQAREHPNRQEEVWTASHPAHAVGGDASTRHNAVDVGVVIEALSPGVQDGGEADVGAEVLGIGGDRRKRLSRRLEQQAIDLGLVLVGDGTDLRWQSEHDVEVRHRQQLGLARLKPGLRRPPLALRAVPIPARVVGDARVGAVFAALDMAAERSGATDLDGRHDAPLGEAQMGAVGRAPASSVAAENIRHLQDWPRHSRCVRSALLSLCSEAQEGSGFAGLC